MAGIGVKVDELKFMEEGSLPGTNSPALVLKLDAFAAADGANGFDPAAAEGLG